VYIEILSLVSLVYFLKLFLRIPELFPKINSVIQGQIYFLLFIVGTIPVLFSFYEQHSFFLLQVINIIMIVVIGLLLYVSIGSYTVQKRNVLFFFSAFGAILIGSVAIILMEFGVLSLDDIEINPYMIGSALELLLFSLGLTFQVKEIYDERNELSSRISRHQKEMMQAYVEGVEKERGRIAGELHDDIGSRLGNLRRIIGGINHAQRDYIEKQVETLSSDVRSLSHQLAPPTNRKGLAQLTEDLILDVQPATATQFSLQCYDVPEKLSENITQQCYRILQEAINNILKHAKAATADIQIFGHDQELVITIEDDGAGFDSGSSKKSIGLQQLKARTESVQGIFEISSSSGKGTQIMIRIPLETHA
jgi:Signal transduction histidine kinase